MRVSDADRERAAETLREAAGDGRLTFDELDQRLELAYAAKTYADLEPITRDLPATGAAAHAPAAGGFPAERIGGTPGSAISLAIMSGAQRAGPWVVPERYTAVAIMGGIELDLRQARFSAPTVTILGFAIMGGVDVQRRATKTRRGDRVEREERRRIEREERRTEREERRGIEDS